MRRLAVFAHFDRESKIDPYVILYLKELKKHVDDIIFVSDGNLDISQKNKVQDICFEILDIKHSQYDFGSYKRGFSFVQENYPEKLLEIYELLFVNDSCYPIGGFDQIFKDMSKKDDCDCWGLTDNYYSLEKGHRNTHHIQSYFISFRKSVFLQQYFMDFLNKIKKLDSHNEITYKYEVGLSRELIKNNKKIYAYYSSSNIGHYIVDNKDEIAGEIYKITSKSKFISKKNVLNLIINSVCNIYRVDYLNSNKLFVLLKMGFPLLKVKAVRREFFSEELLLYFWRKFPSVSKAMVSEIEGHFARIGYKIKKDSIFNNPIHYFLYKIKIIFKSLFYIRRYNKDCNQVTTYKILFFKVKLHKSKGVTIKI